MNAQERLFRLMETRPAQGRRILWRLRFYLFRRAHRGQSFSVFRPEWIARAFTADVRTLYE